MAEGLSPLARLLQKPAQGGWHWTIVKPGLLPGGSSMGETRPRGRMPSEPTGLWQAAPASHGRNNQDPVAWSLGAGPLSTDSALVGQPPSQLPSGYFPQPARSTLPPAHTRLQACVAQTPLKQPFKSSGNLLAAPGSDSIRIIKLAAYTSEGKRAEGLGVFICRSVNPDDVGRPLCGWRPERGPGIQALPAHLRTKELDGRPCQNIF